MKANTKKFLGIAAIFGALAVGLGAFGAHALKAHLLANNRLDTYQTAVFYHFIHTLVLLVLCVFIELFDNPWLNRAAWLFITGILIFSGSLYILCLTGITVLGAITPIGGVLFIAGWVFLFIAARKTQKKLLRGKQP